MICNLGFKNHGRVSMKLENENNAVESKLCQTSQQVYEIHKITLDGP